MLYNKNEFAQAVVALSESGKTLKRRIAVSFEAEADDDGYFRKYGAFIVGDRIIPQHILRKKDWIVKSRFSQIDEAFVKEEHAYVRDNPHAEQLLNMAHVGNIEFGRIDYTLRQGQPVVFEINLNPTFPRFRGGSAQRQHRRDLIVNRLCDAMKNIRSPDNVKGLIDFSLEQVMGHQFIEKIPWYADLPYSI